MNDLDLDFFRKTAGIGRDILETRLRALADEVERLRTENAALNRTGAELHDRVTTTQARCTELLERARLHERGAAVVDSPEGRFLLAAMHELKLGREKYPGPYTADRLFAVLLEEGGEAARAHTHAEGTARVRNELAQTAGVCARIAVECFPEAP